MKWQRYDDDDTTWAMIAVSAGLLLATLLLAQIFKALI